MLTSPLPLGLALAATLLTAAPAHALHRTDCDDGFRAYSQSPNPSPPTVTIAVAGTLEAGKRVFVTGDGQATPGRRIVNYCRFFGDPNKPSEQHFDFLRSSTQERETSTQAHTYSAHGRYTVWIHAIDDRGAWSQRASTELAIGPLPTPPAPAPPPVVAVAPVAAAPVARRVEARVRTRAKATRRGGVRLSSLSVSTERGARVQVRCSGTGCPRRVRTRRATRRLVRFGRFRRALRTGARVEVFVTKSGKVGRYTSLRVRRGRIARSTTSCLAPGTLSATGC